MHDRGMRGLFSWLRGRWAGFAAATAISAGGGLAGNLLIALSLRYLVDAFYFHSRPTLSAAWLALGAAVVALPLCMAGSQYLLRVRVQRLLLSMREAIQNKGLRLPAASFEARHTAELNSLLINDANLVGGGLSSHLASLVSAAAGLLGAFIVLFSWNAPTVLLAAFLTATALLASSRLSAPVNTATAREQVLLSRVMAEGQALASGLLVIKSLRAEETYLRRFDGAVEEHLEAVRLRGRVQAQLTATSAATSELAHPAVYLAAGSAALAGHITPGTAGGIAQLAGQTVQPASDLASGWAELHRAAAASERILALLSEVEEPRAPSAEAGVPPREVQGVEFRDVTFSYAEGGPAVLKGLSFRVPSHQVVALVGESGCGKSTIFKLLLGLYAGYRGRIVVAGKEIRPGTDTAFLRSVCSLCPQDLQLFPFSVRENLELILRNADSERLEQVVQAFRLDHMVAQLPEGWDTPATHLSGGQKQRVAVARAFLKPAPLVLLDEPTSHLDVSNEYLIYDGIRQLAAGRTVLMATHRVANLHWVDRILVLVDGTVVEEGGFTQLLAREGGVFASLHRQAGPRA